MEVNFGRLLSIYKISRGKYQRVGSYFKTTTILLYMYVLDIRQESETINFSLLNLVLIIFVLIKCIYIANNSFVGNWFNLSVFL